MEVANRPSLKRSCMVRTSQIDRTSSFILSPADGASSLEAFHIFEGLVTSADPDPLMTLSENQTYYISGLLTRVAFGYAIQFCMFAMCSFRIIGSCIGLRFEMLVLEFNYYCKGLC